MIYDLCGFYLCVFFVSNTVLVLRGGLVDRKKNCGGGGGWGRRWGGSPRAPYRLAPPLHMHVDILNINDIQSQTIT